MIRTSVQRLNSADLRHLTGKDGDEGLAAFLDTQLNAGMALVTLNQKGGEYLMVFCFAAPEEPPVVIEELVEESPQAASEPEEPPAPRLPRRSTLKD